MKKITKFWLIIATLFIFLGSILFVVSLSLIDWDFSKLETVEYETNTYTFNESYENIAIDTLSTDIVFKKSSNSETKVDCLEMTKLKNSVSVVNNALTIKHEDSKNHLNFIGINTKSPRITIYLPSNNSYTFKIESTTGDITFNDSFTFDELNIELTTGDIFINNITCNNMNIYITTGDVVINNITCNDLTINGTASDIKINNSTLKGKLNIKTTTGDVELLNFDASEIYIKASTGDVEAVLLSEKVFDVKTTTGDINIPKTNSGGICEITTTTGDVEIIIKR